MHLGAPYNWDQEQRGSRKSVKEALLLPAHFSFTPGPQKKKQKKTAVVNPLSPWERNLCFETFTALAAKNILAILPGREYKTKNGTGFSMQQPDNEMNNIVFNSVEGRDGMALGRGGSLIWPSFVRYAH